MLVEVSSNQEQQFKGTPVINAQIEKLYHWAQFTYVPFFAFDPEQLCNYLPLYQGQSAAWQLLYKQTSLPLTLHKVCDKEPR